MFVCLLAAQLYTDSINMFCGSIVSIKLFVEVAYPSL